MQLKDFIVYEPIVGTGETNMIKIDPKHKRMRFDGIDSLKSEWHKLVIYR
jgi:hypothetical protein